jgi:hypothetical protein
MMQPSVLMNRFIINLKSLGTAGSSQTSSARHWSRFSALNFRITDSFLGNISEDLQDGHEPADDDRNDEQEMDAVPLSVQGSAEAESAASSPPVGTQVSNRVRPG